jgi:hypothetical protein
MIQRYPRDKHIRRQSKNNGSGWRACYRRFPRPASHRLCGARSRIALAGKIKLNYEQVAFDGKTLDFLHGQTRATHQYRHQGGAMYDLTGDVMFVTCNGSMSNARPNTTAEH